FISFAQPADGTVLPPWFRPSGFDPDDVLASLNNEILDFCAFVSPTDADKNDVKVAVAYVDGLAQKMFPGRRAETIVFGSQMTGLGLPNSDIDLAINNVPNNALDTLSHELYRRARNGEVTNLEVIRFARVPIIKFCHTATRRNCDICFNMTSGLDTGNIICCFLEDYPQARPLILVLKYFLCGLELNETFHGGIGSFLLALMVVSMLQQRARRDSFTGTSVTFNLGTLLLEFFKLYGDDFNSVEAGISVLRGGYYFLKRDRSWMNPERPFLLSVENPVDGKLDVGANSYLYYPIIRAGFASAHRRMVDSMRCFKLRRERFTAAAAEAGPAATAAAAGGGSAGDDPVSLLSEVIAADELLVERGETWRPDDFGRTVAAATAAAAAASAAAATAATASATSAAPATAAAEVATAARDSGGRCGGRSDGGSGGGSGKARDRGSNSAGGAGDSDRGYGGSGGKHANGSVFGDRDEDGSAKSSGRKRRRKDDGNENGGPERSREGDGPAAAAAAAASGEARRGVRSWSVAVPDDTAAHEATASRLVPGHAGDGPNAGQRRAARAPDDDARDRGRERARGGGSGGRSGSFGSFGRHGGRGGFDSLAGFGGRGDIDQRGGGGGYNSDRDRNRDQDRDRDSDRDRSRGGDWDLGHDRGRVGDRSREDQESEERGGGKRSRRR
ncbi:unnamed protein product, partial [Phaeothamnion confervicola]